MQKDFDGWNEEKKRIQDSKSHKLYNEREVWWCWLGVNIGSEQDGDARYKRPVVIVREFGPSMCYAIPLTTSPKRHKYRHPIGPFQGKEAMALIAQMRVIDTRRLSEKMGLLDQDTFLELRKSLKALL